MLKRTEDFYSIEAIFEWMWQIQKENNSKETNNGIDR